MLTTETATSQPTPELIFDTMRAFQRTAALRAAVELKLFTAIAEGNHTTETIAQRCQASSRGIRILCDYLVIVGLLIKEGDTYALTQDTATFLDERSSAYIGMTLNFVLDPQLTRNFDDLAACVRKGGTISPSGGVLEREHPVWVNFARYMAPMMAMQAQLMAELVVAQAGRPMKVLDIAAGHGLFGINIALRNPAARVVALDWPQVLAVARENAEKFGVIDRWETIAGSALDVPFGEGYDLVLLTNFLHHFDVATNEKLLRKLRAALKDSGQVVTLEFIPNEDRVSPPAAASFSLNMLGNTEAGDAYTFSELETMFRNAGFSRNTLRELPPTIQRIVISQV